MNVTRDCHNQCVNEGNTRTSIYHIAGNIGGHLIWQLGAKPGIKLRAKLNQVGTQRMSLDTETIEVASCVGENHCSYTSCSAILTTKTSEQRHWLVSPFTRKEGYGNFAYTELC